MAEPVRVIQRKALLGKSIITLDDASKAGIVNEIWIDAQVQRVVALGCLVKGKTTGLTVPLNQIQVLGEDAVLIASNSILLESLPEGYTRLVDHDVVTEGGKRLGQVDDYYFETKTGVITNCLLSAGGFSGLLEGHSSLSGAEFTVIGKDRVIVKAGAEERLEQVDKGLQAWVEIGRTKVQETAATLRERMAKKEDILAPESDAVIEVSTSELPAGEQTP